MKDCINFIVNLLMGVVWVLALKYAPQTWMVFLVVVGAVWVLYNIVRETPWWRNR